MHPLRRPFLIASLMIAAVLLSGCVAIKLQSASQRLPGFVTLRVDVCVSDRDRDTYTTCDPAPPNQNTEETDSGLDGDESGDGRGQLLVGFRVPIGTVAPETFQSTDASVTLTKSPSYTAQLTAQRVPPAGFKWEGYLSAELPFDPAEPDDRQTSLRPEFRLPPGPAGAAFDGPLQWRAIVGFRNTASINPGSAVTCNDLAHFCFDSPPAAALATHLTRNVSDIGVLAGTAATAAPGETATVAFPIHNRDEGAMGARTLALAASSTVPGTTATSADSISVAANATPTANVSVAVPPGTPVGSYTVTLAATANAGGGAPLVRSNTATIQVVDRVAPDIRVSTPLDGATFTVGQSVLADYGCTDEAGGSGVQACAGPVPSGVAIDTSSPGDKTFTVNAADGAGNTSGVTRTYRVAPIVVPPEPPVKFTLAFDFRASARGTTLSRLQVKGAPRGATVAVTCKGRSCPTRRIKGKRRTVSFTKRNAPATVSLKPWLRRRLAPGTVLTVTVTKPGSIGMVKTFTIRASKRPQITTTCLRPGSKTARASCRS